MGHVFYATLGNEEAADAAILELNGGSAAAERCSTIVHSNTLDRFNTDHQPIAETRARWGLAHGAVIGVIAGAVCGGALVALGFGPAGMPAATVLFAAIAGAAVGSLAGGLSGAGAPDPTLEKLEEKLAGGGVVVTVDAPGLSVEEEARHIFIKHGALIHERG